MEPGGYQSSVKIKQEWLQFLSVARGSTRKRLTRGVAGGMWRVVQKKNEKCKSKNMKIKKRKPALDRSD